MSLLKSGELSPWSDAFVWVVSLGGLLVLGGTPVSYLEGVEISPLVFSPSLEHNTVYIFYNYLGHM